ncbi:hypothetical protein GPECTOR_262g670 [Gonium pectorale]|uniref:SET domain-containing protein n=1 Tax=Gonium pectorale TaxID=33097 RepID=A0A150FW53_GONPE|nr:hypothetical protein GPECTOR_262g670 [Gonium pectorale]|eukprot:KXZ41852.1 hypothetical protein GPECTOR_262g670 [Gonium pectorale]
MQAGDDDGVAKRYLGPPYGNALVATRDFAPGDVVLRDAPLLATTEDSQLLDRIYDAHDAVGIRADLLGKDASVDFSLQMLQYAAADDLTRSKLRSLFTPDLRSCADEPYVRAATQYAAQLGSAARHAPGDLAASALAPLARLAPRPDEVARVVLAWVCNCYSTVDGGGALYERGSLVNHCCEGNTRYGAPQWGRDYR